MSYIPNNLKQKVVGRASNRCEYCGLSQLGQEATFHVDHVQPIKNGGSTTLDNLALACVSCSLHKAAKQTAIDPESANEVHLYNPRASGWNKHFRWDNVYVKGVDACGRATVEALKFNRPLAIAIREEELLLGRHPT